MTARSADKLEETVKAIKAKGGKAHAYAADLTNDADKIFDAAVEAMGGVDILIANTGGPPARVAAEVEPGGLDAPVRSHGEARLPSRPARPSRHARTRLGPASSPIASSGVIQPIPNLAMSNALRSAIVGWAKTLASEVAKDGITVNLVLPGRIETESHQGARPGQRQAQRQEPGRKSPPPAAPRSPPIATARPRNSATSSASWPPTAPAT